MNELQRDSYAKDAASDGRAAYRSGLPDTSCDRTPGTLEYSAWHDGYEGAKAVDGMSAVSDREIDDWLLMMERLFGKEFLEGAS